MPLVKSSHIRSVKHDERSNSIEVRFWNGSVYEYFNTSKEEADSLIKSASVGKSFHNEIRDIKPTFQTQHKKQKT
ncbi:MAG: KTSC domain-containing protein [Candidatus Kariarchaeaceae archaeon]|jgi:hypothetical protein